MRAGVCHGVIFGIGIGLPRSLFLNDHDITETLTLFVVGLVLSYIAFGFLARRFGDGRMLPGVSIVSMIALFGTAMLAGSGVENTHLDDHDGLDLAEGFVGFVAMLLSCVILALGNMFAGWIGRCIPSSNHAA